MKRTLLSLGLLVVMTVPFVGANHAQSYSLESGAVAKVTFDHTTGNEYWVQAKIHSTHPIVYANVRHESGQFQDFERSSWDPNEYIIGMRVPPGERVQFQILPQDGTGYVTSCFFTHPAGVEQCDPGSTDPFDADFATPTGNEWWQQIYVEGNRPIRFVTMFSWGVNAGEHFLEKRSWGAYAASTYQPSGSIVQFMANSGDEGDASPCYKWPEIVVTTCPPDRNIGRDDTMFDHKAGNEWWVEVTVGPIEPTHVWARDDGGPWVPLTKRSWGVWANSFHIEPGHRVQFTAHVDGGRYESCWFTHPQGMTPENDQSCHGGFVGPVNPN